MANVETPVIDPEAALAPADLLSRCIEGAMALASASIASPRLEDPAIAQAYTAATGLAAEGLRGAIALVQATSQPTSGLEGLETLAAAATALTERLDRLQGNR